MENPRLTFVGVFFSGWKKRGGLRFGMFHDLFRPAFFVFTPFSFFIVATRFSRKRTEVKAFSSPTYQIPTAPVAPAVVVAAAFPALFLMPVLLVLMLMLS